MIYEWDIETQTTEDTADHESGEVLDHHHLDTYKACRSALSYLVPHKGIEHVIALVRDDDMGRSWAYIDNGELPVDFCDAYGNAVARVPKRFHAEVSRGNA